MSCATCLSAATALASTRLWTLSCPTGKSAAPSCASVGIRHCEIEANFCTKRAFHWACITLQCEQTFGFESERPGESMGEVVGRKKKAVVAGALALTLGAGLGLGAVAWGSEGSVPEGGVTVWGCLGRRWWARSWKRKRGPVARSHRAEVQRALAAYRASEAVEREAATEAGEQTPAEAAGAQDAHLSAEGPGASSGEAAGACSEEADRADEQRGGQEASKGSGSAAEGGGLASQPSAPGSEPSEGSIGGRRLCCFRGGAIRRGIGRCRLDRSSLARWWWAVPPFPTAMCAAARRRAPEAACGWGRTRWTTAAGAISSGTTPARSRRCARCPRAMPSSCATAREAQRAYTVREVFQVEETATWKTIASRVTGYGESVVLQTCAGDGMNVIVVAA